MELLEGVVREDRRVGLLCDGQHECVTSADGAGRRCHEFVVRDPGLELGHLPLVDAMFEPSTTTWLGPFLDVILVFFLIVGAGRLLLDSAVRPRRAGLRRRGDTSEGS